MFFERVAILILQLRAKLLGFLKFLFRETNSQYIQLVLTCFLFFFTVILVYVWVNSSPLWIKLCYSVIFILCAVISATIIYFYLKNKRVRDTPHGMKVYTFNSHETGKFQYLNLKSIPLTKDQAHAVFTAFSLKYLNGSYHSFQLLIHLKPIAPRNRLEWKDPSPKRPELVNRQTLLEFLSHLLIGFENLENHQMIALVAQYFILRNPAGIEQDISSKNISDWRTNKAAYLKEVSRLFQHNL